MKLNNSSLLKKRLKNLQQHLERLGVDGCIIQSPIDLYYLTGLSLSLGSLILSKEECRLFVDGRYIQVALEKSPVRAVMSDKKNIHLFLKKHPAKKVAFDSQHTPYANYEKVKQLFPGSELAAVENILRDLRLIKDSEELEAMRKSAKLLWKGFQALKKKIKAGITETDLALEFEIFCRKQGAEKLAFDPIIAFGPNSAMPHYHPHKVRLKKGQIVLIDIGVTLDSYRSDMTRTLFFGTPDPLLKKWWKIVKESHDAALKICKSGVKLGELDKAARKVMAKEGVEGYYLHSLGHGIGLETHEYPRIKVDGEDKELILKEGMVITVEPGLYMAGKGGIRYEDTVIVTKSGYENLYPKES